jgi:hypothetical protein
LCLVLVEDGASIDDHTDVGKQLCRMPQENKMPSTVVNAMRCSIMKVQEVVLRQGKARAHDNKRKGTTIKVKRRDSE